MKLSRHRRYQLISLLSLLLLLQGLFPMQLHTQLVRNDNGQLVEMCTIDGIQTMAVDGEGNIRTDHFSKNNRSAAMAFSDLMAEAIPTAFKADYLKDGPVSQSVVAILKEFHGFAVEKAGPIRAPPVPVIV